MEELIVLVGLVSLLVIVGVAIEERKRTQYAIEWFKTVLNRVVRDPTNVELQREFLLMAHSNELIRLPLDHSQLAYGMALAALEATPQNSAVRQFALDVGRWHLARAREDNRCTIYDEQALLNDILVRAGGDPSNFGRPTSPFHALRSSRQTELEDKYVGDACPGTGVAILTQRLAPVRGLAEFDGVGFVLGFLGVFALVWCTFFVLIVWLSS